jgi:hypothetical protein
MNGALRQAQSKLARDDAMKYQSWYNPIKISTFILPKVKRIRIPIF